MAAFYYYVPDKTGPVDLQTLRHLAKAGVINRETIIEDQSGRKYYARQIPELFEAAVPVPPTTTPTPNNETPPPLPTDGLDPKTTWQSTNDHRPEQKEVNDLWPSYYEW